MVESPALLQQFLEGRDVGCPGCGYNLRDLQTDRCPECGEELSLRVGLLEPKQGASIAGLIGLAAGAGMNGLLLGYLLIRIAIFRDPYGRFMYRFGGLNLAGLLVEGLAILIWLRAWRWIRKLSGSAKLLLVVGCWILTLADIVVFSLFIK
jgi:hypothetical protein